MRKKPIIIGITGAFGSGKSTAAAFFESKGARTIMLASFLEEEAKKRGARKITRKILQDIGNEWRKRYGRNILAKKALELFKRENTALCVIDGLRNIGEVEELRKNKGFVLLAIVADRKIRFERLKRLKRREPLTWELFTRLDRRDLGLGQKSTGLQVASCIAMSDVFIDNNGGIEEFRKKLENFLQGI